jgi:hypothetical protein
MEFRDTGAPRDDLFPVCWRPAGHTRNRHLSRYAYLNELARRRGASRRKYPEYRRAA